LTNGKWPVVLLRGIISERDSLVRGLALNRDDEAPDFRAELFEAIGHPTRIKILQVLKVEPMGFAGLKRAVGVESSGNMAFHLAKLRNLIAVGPDGNYALTDDGKEALWSISAISGDRKEPGPALQVRRAGRNRQRITTATLLIALIILAFVVATQQLQIGTQQGVITSQQKQVALFYNEIPLFANGQSASQVLGQNDFTSYKPTSSPGGVDTPTQVLFDSSGNMWVVDFANYRVLEFKPPFSSGMSSSLSIGHQEPPAYDSTGAQLSPEYWPNTASGLGPGGYRLPAPPGGYYSEGDPTGAAFDSSGNLWVADSGSNRILEFKTPFSDGMNASLVIGQKNFTNGCLACTGSILGPLSRLTNPTQPVFDSSGNLWVLDGGDNRVLEFRPPFTDGMGAFLVIGQSNFTGNEADTTQTGLNCFYGSLAIDPTGNLWVGDDGNNRILEFKPPFVNGMAASIVIGQPNFTSSSQTAEGYATNLGLNVAFDPGGNLWATFNHRLLEYKPPFSSNMLPTLEIGQPDFTSIAWGGGQSGLSVFIGIPGFDPSGNLWVPDSGNNRVLEFPAASPIALSNPVQGTQPFGNLQLVEVGSAVLAAAALSVIVFSRIILRPKKT
jgi:NHL repeat-containing protein